MPPPPPPPLLRSLEGPDGAWQLWGLHTREDNYAWVLADPRRRAIAIDAPDPAPVLRLLQTEHLDLHHLLITHAHPDHTEGIPALRAATRCLLHHVPPPGTPLQLLGLPVRVLDTSGHSDADRSFVFDALALCCCGDTLFAGGCGRIFAGPASRMWQSILQLRALPDDTLLCPGHDYALDNLRFAAQTFPGIPAFRERLLAAETAARSHTLFPPVRLGDETRANPMLMADHPAIARTLGLDTADPAACFARIRELRNLF